ncbi:hypothetical protein [Geomonas oryzae]|uniref:hypothetical protein n=1 Tax=Geomonas oryzae TaxID=2364273 RepID=UPI001FE95196|nr:hypothetical protein [Geomonas oryzae]
MPVPSGARTTPLTVAFVCDMRTTFWTTSPPLMTMPFTTDSEKPLPAAGVMVML